MKDICVIGGGVVGISCALALQAEGYQVTVLDPGPTGEGASWASCGCIAVGEIVPLSQPKMLMQVPGWLMDPEAPLALRPSSLPGLLPWFTRFLMNATPQKMRAIASDLAWLTFRATDDFKAQLADIGQPDLLVERPVLKLFDDERDKASMGAAFDLARALGCRIDDISGAEAKEIEPAIAGDFKYACVLQDWSYVTNPVRLVQCLTKVFQTRGGALVSQAAVGFEREGASVSAVMTSAGERITADAFVLAAGTSARDLSRKLGVPLPIAGLAGYSTVLPHSQVDLRHTLFYPKGGFGMTPYEDGLAVAGTVEFVGHGAAPNWQRAKILVQRAQRVLPGLGTDQGHERMGRRPFTPDTRPIIGRPKGVVNLHFAIGHGQLGLTLGATTARLIADQIAGRTTPSELAAFSPDRFLTS
jgi:D-amino-acid dehydrogenase